MYTGTIILLNIVFSSLFLAPRRDVPPNIRKSLLFSRKRGLWVNAARISYFSSFVENDVYAKPQKSLFASFSKISS